MGQVQPGYHQLDLGAHSGGHGLTLIITYTRGDVAYAAVLEWALGGMLMKQMGAPMVPDSTDAVIVIIIIVVTLKKS